jgi:hypothetical protein
MGQITIGKIIGLIVALIGIVSVFSMFLAMSSGDIDRGTEILANSLIPLEIGFLVLLAGCGVFGAFLAVLFFIFKDKIMGISVSY